MRAYKEYSEKYGISEELYSWLKTRDELLEVKSKFRETGGHIMLRGPDYNVDELDEPLRSEAKKFISIREKAPSK